MNHVKEEKMTNQKIILFFVVVLLTSWLGGSWNLARSAEKENQDKEKAEFKVGYKIGKGLNIEAHDGDYEYQINLFGYVQPRFTYNSLEAAPDTDGFVIQRGKIGLKGYVFQKQLNYGFLMNLATRAANSGNAVLDDYFIDWVPKDYFGFKVGQFKVPFLMQELTPDTVLQFVDRSSNTIFFSFVRDIGLDIHGKILESKKLTYHLFAFNGDGVNTINSNQGLMGGARLEYSILGSYLPTESDIEGSEDPQLGVGLAYVFADSQNGTGLLTENGTLPVGGTQASNGTVDVGWKYRRFSLFGAANLTRTHEGASLTNWGYTGQFGYMIVPKHFEAAVKGAGSIFTNAVANVYEYGAGLSYFWRGHTIKLQSDYTLLMNNRGINLNDHRFRTQLQVIF